MSFSWKSLWIAGLLGGILPGGITGNEADAATNRWLGTAGVNWADDANWELGHAPIAGEQVVIDATASSHVLLTNPTPWLASFFITNRTLTFSNWTTALQATQVTVAAAGKFTLPNAFAAGAMSNRIWVICSNLTVHPQGQMIGDALGYLNAAGPGVGANGGGGGGGGAGHANRGGDGGGGGAGGAAYGDAAAPLAPGSGGGTGYDPGGKGGGAIRIEADDRVEIHGTLSVNGSKGGANSRGGGGSGGSIYITCRRFAGSTNGLISAQGADGENNQFDYCGGGGSGGRIAVLYDSTAQAAEPRPAVRFRAYGGTSYNPLAGQSDDGTLYFPDPSILTNVLQDALFKNVQLTIPGWTQWRVDSLWVSNCSFTVATPSFVLGVTQSLTIHSNGVLKLYPATVDCHTLVLTNGGQFWVTAGPTTTVNRFGAEIRVTDGLWIGAGSWVYAFADPTNGGIPRFQTGALTVQNGGGIRADNAGFQGSYGPGKGANGGGGGGGGGGHGGRGGNGSTAQGGKTNDSLVLPILPGSGGGAGYRTAGRGGGAIWMEVERTAKIDGLFSANGQFGLSRSGGSAGGGILLACRVLDSLSTTRFRAHGANGNMTSDTNWYGGGGGGGRISIWEGVPLQLLARSLEALPVPSLDVTTNHPTFQGAATVSNGTAYGVVRYGEPGTVTFVRVIQGMIFIIH